MKTLQEYIKIQGFTKQSDKEIIISYLLENDLETEMVDIIVELLKGKVAKMQDILTMSRAVIPSLFSKANAKNPKEKLYVFAEEELLLNKLTAYFLLDMDVPETVLEKARKVIPNCKQTTICYVPMVNWLKEKYGIEFQQEKKK